MSTWRSCSLASVDLALLMSGRYKGTDKLARMPMMAMANSNSNIVKAPSFLCFKTVICFLKFISGETNVVKLLEKKKTPAA